MHMTADSTMRVDNLAEKFRSHTDRTCVRPAFRGIRFESRSSLALS